MSKKKRAVIIILLVFLTLFIVYMFAAKTPTGAVIQESIHTSTVVSGDTIEVENMNVTFTITNIAAYADFGDFSMILPGGECKTRDNLKVCIGSIIFKERNYEDYTDIYETTVDFYVTQAVEVNKTIERTTMLIDESSDVKVVIRNVGSTETTDMFYIDEYPRQIELTNVAGCTLLPNNIIEWRGFQTPNGRQICTYTMTGREGVTFTSEARVGYKDGLRMQNISGKVTITVQNYSIQVEKKINASSLKIDNAINITLTLKNIHDNEISITSFKISTPPSFDILYKDGDLRRVESSEFLWVGTLQPNEMRNFTLHLFATKTGLFTIPIEERYTVNGLKRNIKEQIPLEIGCDCPKVEHTTLRNPLIGEIIPFRVEIKNPSDTLTFTAVNVSIATNIPFADSTTTKMDELIPQDSFFVLNQDITIPEESYQYNVTLSYITPFGQEIVEQEQIIISPNPPDIIDTNKTVNATENEVEELINSTEEIDEGGRTESEESTQVGEESSGIIAGIIVILIIGAIIFAFVRLIRD
jgi:hypothetical protein